MVFLHTYQIPLSLTYSVTFSTNSLYHSPTRSLTYQFTLPLTCLVAHSPAKSHCHVTHSFNDLINNSVRTTMRPSWTFWDNSGDSLTGLEHLDFPSFERMRFGPTDPRTDRPSYRDAWTHLKTQKLIQRFNLLLSNIHQGVH